MCGIIGYIGDSKNGEFADPNFFYNGLKRLEYRGYDSAGIAVLGEDSSPVIVKAEGKLINLKNKLNNLPNQAVVGIGHTRWATHGRPTEDNAHPHRSGPIVLLHNGIIENFEFLRGSLSELGFEFKSETDTESAVHLLHKEYRSLGKDIDPVERMKISLSRLINQIEGSYAFAIMCQDTPDILYAVKKGSPLVLGKGENANYLASGIAALVDHTKTVTMLEDGDIAILTKDKIDVFDKSYNLRDAEYIEVEWSSSMLDKGGYEHFMLKEIYEHPTAVSNTIGNRICNSNYNINLQDYGISSANFENIERIDLIACGTSYYAASMVKYFIEDLTHLPVSIDVASEYRYRTITANKNTLAVAISQSGETIDTLFAVKAAKERGAQTLAIVNCQGSSIGMACDMESLLDSGPEIGVASTKAFASMVVSLQILGLAIAQEKKLVAEDRIAELSKQIFTLPNLITEMLDISNHTKQLAEKYESHPSMFYIGRGPYWAAALEGALKLKEISYIHAEGYAAGELKHGPIALIDDDVAVVAICPKGNRFYEKTISNIQEIKARGGKVIGVGSKDDNHFMKICDDYIAIPETVNFKTSEKATDISTDLDDSVEKFQNLVSPVQPLLTTIPLHLFAYWIAVTKGTDVDQPRNLAKSVTVE